MVISPYWQTIFGHRHCTQIMASIDRTAYPHFNKRLSDKELSNCYGLNDEEQDFIHRYARNDRGYLVLSVILKTRQRLGYFAALQNVPNQIVTHLSAQLEVDSALRRNISISIVEAWKPTLWPKLRSLPFCI